MSTFPDELAQDAKNLDSEALLAWERGDRKLALDLAWKAEIAKKLAKEFKRAVREDAR